MSSGTNEPEAGTAPVLYLSHGAPPLADDPVWTRQLADWSAELPRPENILIISGHRKDAPITLSSTTGAPLVYDFWGFPDKYYEVGYDAPPATAVAAEVAALLGTPGHFVVRDEVPRSGSRPAAVRGIGRRVRRRQRPEFP
jgi:4,5-DOPA dioxygenase extradiol